MKPVIFLGPSLPWDEARKVTDAIYMPPIKRGDLPSLPEGVRVIGIVDGVFMGEAAVGHREIIKKLKEGVKIIGGGSMGALRAAELTDLGMIGVGRVFELYSSGTIEGDDEVALIFNPETLEPMSEPLVNMRVNLMHAVKDKVISKNQCNAMIDELKAVYFPKRTMQLLSEISRQKLDSGSFCRFREFIEAKYEDVKRKDAINVLSRVGKLHLNVLK